ncbi:MAG: hypothetical protein KUG73_05295 [Pseudomonadales bacterium]|nr:hypothetical protein [Pseudomonadales bacterium]
MTTVKTYDTQLMTGPAIGIEIKGDGDGLPEEHSSTGYCIKNMKNHAQRINANLNITSDDNGTIIHLVIPLSNIHLK